MSTITKQFHAVADHFLRHKVPVDFIDKPEQTVQVTLPLPFGRVVTRVRVSPDGRFVLFQAGVLAEVPVRFRLQVAEAITRINYANHYGGFQLDFSDGEVTFRCVNVLGDSLDDLDDLLIGMMAATFHALEEFGPALQAVSTGALAPGNLGQ